MNQVAASIGEVVLHYQIEERLGAGGMGVVFRALDLRLKRHVALKFLPPHLLIGDSYRDRLMREAMAASALEHPNIGVVHAVEETGDGRLFIVMACYPGGTLKDRLERGPLPRAEAVAITLQVARGLSEAHAKGVLHRDIKPSNLILTPQGVVKIVDFGLAKILGGADLTETGTTMGTAAYMSPEQATGGVVDHRSDLWSLGIVLYEMLSGRPPFGGENTASLLYAVVHQDVPPMAGAPPPLPGIIQRCISKRPQDRYADMTQLIHHLENWQAPVSASVPSEPSTQTMLPIGPASSRAPGRSLALWLGVLLALAVLGGAAWIWQFSHKPPRPEATTQPTAPPQPAAQPSQPATIDKSAATDEAAARQDLKPPSKPATAARPKKQEPAVYSGPKEGRIVWTGELESGQELVLAGKDAPRSVSGGPLPGVPVSVEIHPTSFRVITPPSADNQWRRLVVRNEGQKQVAIMVNWTVISQ